MRQAKIALTNINFIALIVFSFIFVNQVAGEDIVPPRDLQVGLYNLFQDSDGDTDLAHTKLTIDAIIDPSVDVEAHLVEIDAMADGVRALAEQMAQIAFVSTSTANADQISAYSPATFGGFQPTTEQILAAPQRYIYDPGPWNDHRPFVYDMDDPLGEHLPHKLLSTYLDTRKGNCVSMPTLFIALGDRLGLDMTLAKAPRHLYVVFRDEDAGVVLN